MVSAKMESEKVQSEKMESEKVVLTLAYDGNGFHGFQRQKNLTTVQGAVESALKKIFDEEITIHASGRTDEGVHALGQVAHFVAPKDMESSAIMRALNFYLPEKVRVVNVEKRTNFHARFSAKKKTYLYKTYVSDIDDPFMLGRSLRLKAMPDIAMTQKALSVFIGKHDFSSFYALGSSAKTTVRQVISASLKVEGNELFFLVCADGFLYKMMRMIVSAAIRVGQGKLSINDLESALSTGKNIGKVALPGDALYLLSVEY